MIENLKTLNALEKNGTMLRAATELRISQSAISKRIANLEIELERKLIRRQGRKVVLTLDGINILNKARPLLVEIQNLSHLEKSPLISKLPIGVSESVLSSWGAKTLGILIRKFKDIEILPHSHRSPVVIDKVRSGEYILGLCAGICIKAPELEYREVGHEFFVLLKSEKIKTTELMTIEENSETWASIASQVKRAGLTPTKRLESFFSIAQMARYGDTNALIPIGVAKSLSLPKSRYKILKIKRPIILVGRKTTFERNDILPVIEELIFSLRKSILTLNKI